MKKLMQTVVLLGFVIVAFVATLEAREDGSVPTETSIATMGEAPVMRSVEHVTARYANNRAEVSHQTSRQRERQMRGFKSAAQAQRFLSVQGVVLDLFRLGRHRLRSANYRTLRGRAFAVWTEVTAA